MNHHDASNVLAVLEESHDVARYRQDGTLAFPIHGHMASKAFDFYFKIIFSSQKPLYHVPSHFSD